MARSLLIQKKTTKKNIDVHNYSETRSLGPYNMQYRGTQECMAGGCLWAIITFYSGLALHKYHRKKHKNHWNTNWSKFRSELKDKLNYHWFRIESKECLGTVAVMLDTSPKDSSNSSCPTKIIQVKNTRRTGELNEFKKHATRKLRKALQNNVLANWNL